MLHDVTTNSNHLATLLSNKKRLVGADDITLADIYAPMKDNLPRLVGMKQNRYWIVFRRLIQNFMNLQWICLIVIVFMISVKSKVVRFVQDPNVRPFVMLNHLGKQRDVATLAHELGHAIHAYFTSEQSLINYHAILPVCETASVFCEMLVIDALKKKAKTKEEKIGLLTTQLEDIFATSHRQNMFSRFEKQIHEKINQQRLSGSELSGLYTNELKLMFGDSVDIPDEYAWEWSPIPHMLDVPFYVYSYNFGNLLVFGLYQLYLDEGVTMIPKLKRI